MFSQLINIINNMGFKYVLFRIYYQAALKSGLFKLLFPSKPLNNFFISLAEWKKLEDKFFFNSREDLCFLKTPSESIKKEAENIFNGKIRYFSSIQYDLGISYDWLTNPDNGYKYDISKHWSEINDFSGETGDIKYVWEKSRFSYLYSVIRYDYHFEKDSSEFVINEILSWINSNPINRGPNYKCSQEISLRVLNWVFSLHFYKNSLKLNEEVFQKIINSIYLQMMHVYKNIHFSRIAVRNNHSVTETLALYLIGLIMPFFPESEVWLKKGKSWFEEEIEYQVYNDGTYIQFSHNYQRVLVQLLTWAIILSKRNKIVLHHAVFERAKVVIHYLETVTNESSGQLPNYGANDGALFFPLNGDDYRDYRSQINALNYSLFSEVIFADNREDTKWYSNNIEIKSRERKVVRIGVNKFEDGGIYTFRDDETFTFIKCAQYKDRPSHADNLHIDLWYNEENILRDSGTYKYNTEAYLQKYFSGTAGHNTVMLDKYDQMKKGNRFIWYNWSKVDSIKTLEDENSFIFEGEISAFMQVSKDIKHKRKLTKIKDKVDWEIIDEISGKNNETVHQIWNPSPSFSKHFTITSYNKAGDLISPEEKAGFYSSFYGVKEETDQILFSNTDGYIKTIIRQR